MDKCLLATPELPSHSAIPFLYFFLPTLRIPRLNEVNSLNLVSTSHTLIPTSPLSLSRHSNSPSQQAYKQAAAYSPPAKAA